MAAGITDTLGERGLTYGLMAAGFGALVFVKGFRWAWEKRRIENTPTSTIRSLAMGPVEVNGKASAAGRKVLASPFSRSGCVYYRYQVEQYKSSGKRSHWETVARGEESVVFTLSDATGSVLVDPSDAHVEIPEDNEWESGMFRNPPPAVAEFLTAKGMSSHGVFGISKKMRYTEWFIAPGDTLYVMGTAGDNPAVAEGSGQRNEADIMLQKGKDFYYISDRSEKDILSGFRWKVLGGLFGGAALVLIGLAVVFAYLGLL